MTRVVRLAVVGLLLLGAIGTYVARSWRLSHALTADEITALPARLERIPLRFEDPPFHGTREELEERIVELSGADYYSAAVYRAGDGGTIRLHLGAAVRTGDWLHEPTVCLPTHGWTTREVRQVPAWEGLSGVQESARVWRMELHKAGEELLVYYWFQWGERIVTSTFQRSWRRFQGLLRGERDRPIQIVILYAPLEGGLPRTEERVALLVRALWPHLSTVLSGGDGVHAAFAK